MNIVVNNELDVKILLIVFRLIRDRNVIVNFGVCQTSQIFNRKEDLRAWLHVRMDQWSLSVRNA